MSEKITTEQRKKLIKDMSFSIGLCTSVKPERKAEASLETVEKYFDLVKKG